MSTWKNRPRTIRGKAERWSRRPASTTASCSEAVEVLGRFQEHLEVNGVDFSQSEMVLGPWLEMDSQREEFTGDSDLVQRANKLLRGSYRKPFVVPEHV